MLAALFPANLAAQVLNFPDDDIRLRHEHTNTEYIRDDGTGEAPDSAPIFHIPIESANNTPYLTTPELSVSLITGSVARSVITIPVEVSISSTNDTLDAFIAAPKSGSQQYQVVHNHPGVADDDNIDLKPDLKNICDEDGSLELDCTPFRAGRTGKDEITLFLAIGVRGQVDASPSADSIDPADYPDGIYIKLKLSSVISATPPELLKLHKGDGRLGAQFDLRGINTEDGDSLYAYVQEKTPSDNDNCNDLENALAGTYATLPENDGVHRNLRSLSAAGTVSIRHLKNNICYSIQMYYRDKYQFASQLSNGFHASPESLEKLLEKNSCFLLTAGFGGDDPIVDDFRHFRDHTLRHSFLGRALIHLYYTFAPALAPYVAASPFLSSMVRGAAQTFHSLFLLNI